VIKFLNFIGGFRDALLLAICLFLSFVLITYYDHDPGNPLRHIVYNSVGLVSGYFFKIDSYFELKPELIRLRRQNVDLASKNMQLQDAYLENIRLRKLLEFKERSSFKLIAAEVLGFNPHPIFNGLILNEGSRRGIKKRDAVLTAEGLVGQIVQVDVDNCICQILFDRNSRISSQIQRNRELGVIAWDGGVHLKLLYVAKTIDVLVGDVVLTSGYSRIFPGNLKIGVVIEVSKDNEGLFQDIVVQPSVNFNRLEEVFIFKEAPGNVP
jgi:rod shape-determining protein MreC